MISLGNAEIKEVVFGNTSASGVYVGNQVVWPEQAPTPTGPVQLEYVMNTPGVVSGYVDTGYAIDVDTSVSASLSGNCDGRFYFGTIGNGSNRMWRFFNTGNADEIYFDCGGARKNLGSHTWDRTKWTGVSAYNNGVIVTRDGEVAYSYSGSTQGNLGLPSGFDTIRIMGSDNGDYKIGSTAACGGLKIFDGGDLAMDLVPAKYEDRAGFWDQVSRTMLYPKNGEWTAGPEIGPIS